MLESIHQFAVFAMTGVIWLVQLVHYPSFLFVEKSRWSEFHKAHTFWITPVVAPLMLVQLGSSFFFEGAERFLFVGLSLAVFALTFLISVPLHQKLEKSFDEDILKKLIRTNWMRTLLWSLHSLSIFLIGAKSL